MNPNTSGYTFSRESLGELIERDVHLILSVAGPTNVGVIEVSD